MEKHYGVKHEDGELVSITVDGVEYTTLDDIPDADDRVQIEKLLARDLDAESDEAFDARFDEEFARMSSGSSAFPKILAGIFAAIAILMFAIAGISAFIVVRMLGQEAHAPGRVVELVTRYDVSGNEFFYPVVTFSLPDEKQLEVQLAEGSWPAAYEVGDRVQIAYNPAQPRSARIDTPGNTFNYWIVTLVTGILAVAFTGATALALWIGKSP